MSHPTRNGTSATVTSTKTKQAKSSTAAPRTALAPNCATRTLNQAGILLVNFSFSSLLTADVRALKRKPSVGCGSCLCALRHLWFNRLLQVFLELQFFQTPPNSMLVVKAAGADWRADSTSLHDFAFRPYLSDTQLGSM